MWSILSWIRDWISDYTWFWSNSSDSKINTILLIGLDDAGKTTLTGRLTQNRLIQASPTGNPSTHEIQIGSTRLAMTDVGGHQQARRLWRDYLYSSTRLIFVIDASNRDRIGEARYELFQILKDDETRFIPILILANKIDQIETAMSEFELIDQLKISSYLQGENPRMKLSMCSIKRNEGFADGLKWLIKQQIKIDE